MKYELVINETQRQIILTALAQSQMHRHYGATADTRAEADVLLGMFDDLPVYAELDPDTVHDFTM